MWVTTHKSLFHAACTAGVVLLAVGGRSPEQSVCMEPIHVYVYLVSVQSE